MKSLNTPQFERLSPTSEEYKFNNNIGRRTPGRIIFIIFILCSSSNTH